MHSGSPKVSARRQLNAAPTTTGSSWVWGYRLMQTTATQAACNRAASKPLARPPSRASRWRPSQARTSPTRRSSWSGGYSTISNCTRRRTSWPTQHWTPSASYPSCKNWTRGPQRKNLERLSTTSRPENPLEKTAYLDKWSRQGKKNWLTNYTSCYTCAWRRALYHKTYAAPRDSDSVQEQGRPHQLQQPPGNIPTEHRWQSVCQSHLNPTAGLGSARVLRVLVRVQSK